MSDKLAREGNEDNLMAGNIVTHDYNEQKHIAINELKN